MSMCVRQFVSSCFMCIMIRIEKDRSWLELRDYFVGCYSQYMKGQKDCVLWPCMRVCVCVSLHVIVLGEGTVHYCRFFIYNNIIVAGTLCRFPLSDKLFNSGINNLE